jgi:hydroxymethylglutaryl-CoA reductase
VQVTRVPVTRVVRVDVLIDVRDSMGANRLNTAAELIRPLLEELSGGRTLMAILSNEARDRIAGAQCEIPCAKLEHLLPPAMSGEEAARRIAAASALAQEDPSRAVAHNKGIMNGVSSLALATMNDTRAIEAAAHAWAARNGNYAGISTWNVENGRLTGWLEMPLPMATTGGSVGFHPAARASLRILGFPDAPRLCRIAAAVGLAQNFAALLALVTHGIQKGHMRYHFARLAWRAGARGAEVRRLAESLARTGNQDEAAARALLARLRESAP